MLKAVVVSKPMIYSESNEDYFKVELQIHLIRKNGITEIRVDL